MNYETVPRDLNKDEINEVRIEWTLKMVRNLKWRVVGSVGHTFFSSL